MSFPRVISISEHEIEAVQFDMDGSLTDTEPHFSSAYNKSRDQTANQFGLDLNHLEHQPGVSTIKVFQPWIDEVVGDDHDLRRKIYEYFYECFLDNRRYIFEEVAVLMDDARRILDQVESLRILRSVVTSSTRDQLAGFCRLNGLESFFGALVCKEDMDREDLKPSQAPYDLGMKRLGVDNRLRCIGFEDSWSGLESLIRFGPRFVIWKNPEGHVLPQRLKDLCLPETEIISVRLYDEIEMFS